MNWSVALSALSTLAVAGLSVFVGHHLRGREWLKERRIEAYSALMSAADELADSTLRAGQIHLGLGDQGIRENPRGQEALENLQAAVTSFRRACDAAVLVAGKDAYAGVVSIADFGKSLAGVAPRGTGGPALSTIPTDLARRMNTFVPAAAREIGNRTLSSRKVRGGWRSDTD